MDGGAWSAAVPGVAKSRRWLSDFTFTFHFHALEKEKATHSSVLAWRIQGTGEPGGLPSVGSHRVGHDWCNLVVKRERGFRPPTGGWIGQCWVVLENLNFLKTVNVLPSGQEESDSHVYGKIFIRIQDKRGCIAPCLTTRLEEGQVTPQDQISNGSHFALWSLTTRSLSMSYTISWWVKC